jgi:FKBP-type peptidyl-prolyl cis-trans isomerase FkpA
MFNIKNFIVAAMLFLSTVVLGQNDSLAFIEKVKTLAPSAKPTSIGVWVAYSQTGTGAKPTQDQYVLFSYVAKTINGVEFDRTTLTDPAIVIPGTGAMPQGIDAMLEQVRKGDKIKVFVPSRLGFGATAVGELPPNSNLVYDLDIINILSVEQYDSLMVIQEEKDKLNWIRKEKAYFDEQQRRINDYSVSKKLKSKRTDSGLYYAVTKTGKGDFVQPGDSIFLNYEGFIIEGDKPFDAATGKKIFAFEVGAGGVIEGFDQGLRFFNKGSQGWILVPSRLGYRDSEIRTKSGALPPHTALAFKVKVIDIKRAKRG